jgi:hypothetical protein
VEKERFSGMFDDGDVLLGDGGVLFGKVDGVVK